MTQLQACWFHLITFCLKNNSNSFKIEPNLTIEGDEMFKAFEYAKLYTHNKFVFTEVLPKLGITSYNSLLKLLINIAFIKFKSTKTSSDLIQGIRVLEMIVNYLISQIYLFLCKASPS